MLSLIINICFNLFMVKVLYINIITFLIVMASVKNYCFQTQIGVRKLFLIVYRA